MSPTRTTARVDLNLEEQRVVYAIAKKKTDNSINGGLKSSWKRDNDPYLSDRQGYGAEVAFCKYTNTFPDLTSHNRVGGVDSILPDGTRVDVKWTSKSSGDLLVKKDRKKRGYVDLYVLITGSFPNYEIVGYATEDEVFSARVTNYGYCDNYTLYQSELHDITDLKQYGVLNFGIIGLDG